MAHSTSASEGINSSTRKGSIATGTPSSQGGGTFQYSATHSTVICSIVTQAGGRGRSVAYLYHPFIQVNDYFSRGGSKMMRDSESAQAKSALQRQFS